MVKNCISLNFLLASYIPDWELMKLANLRAKRHKHRHKKLQLKPALFSQRIRKGILAGQKTF